MPELDLSKWVQQYGVQPVGIFCTIYKQLDIGTAD